jgi:peroxiredoxin
MAGLIVFALYQNLSATGKERLEVGDKAPDFQLQTLDGKVVKLSDYHGKVVLINFWATWCQPCRTEMPDLQKVYESWRGRGLEVLAVNIAETPVAVQAFKKELGLTFPILLDSQKEVTKLYKVGPIPTSFFVDESGKIIRIFQGQMNRNQMEQGVMESLRAQ